MAVPPPSRPGPTLSSVLQSASELQRLVADTVMVGGSAAALYAGHRESVDHDHVLVLRFRNLDIAPDAPVQDWPTEAVLTALERGSLCHWRQLAAAVRCEPWGPVADRVEQALRVSQAYGVVPLLERALARARGVQPR